MSEAEVDELERQEIEAEEAEERKKRRNILEDLENRFDEVTTLSTQIHYTWIVLWF